MDKLKKLELNKLVHEYEFIQSDYEYKHELIHKADKDFIESVNKVVDSHPELKKIYQKRFEQQNETTVIDEDTDRQHEKEESTETELLEKNPKIKNLYRNIVKKTHPDRIGDSKLNNLYIESTKYYQQDDLLSLYKICDKLDIDYEFEDNDYFLIQTKIDKLKEKIKFLESTFTWLWINSEESQKNEIILSFVRLQITT